MWKDKSEVPAGPGYYLTYYHNIQLNIGPRNLFKAFYWNGTKWVFRFDPEVICWWDVKHDYYVPCQMQDGVEPLPKQYMKGTSA